jgi:tetratricopeptide (TPR) repeat protein
LMFTSRVLAIALSLYCALAIVPPPVHAAQSEQDKAAALYQRGDYDRAYKQYQKRARDGDTFAQYRVSYMTLMGLGTRADAVESMAWAVLAAEGEDESLDEYREAVAAMVPAKKRRKAQKQADYFLRRWGRDEDYGDRNPSPHSGGGCTGSRLAANCNTPVSSGGYHIAWGQDNSEDPAQRKRIEELNRAIVEDKAEETTTGS